MAENDTKKDKYLYVLGTEHGQKFFNGGRAIASVDDIPHTSGKRISGGILTLVLIMADKRRDFSPPH